MPGTVGARSFALGGDRSGAELWWAPEGLFCSAEQSFAGGDEAPLSYARPNFGAAPSVNCRIERATLLRVGRGQAVGLYAPLPASRRLAQNGRGHFDPWMAAVVSWVRGDPVPLLRTAEAARFLSMPFDLAIRRSPSRMAGGGGSELVWSWLCLQAVEYHSPRLPAHLVSRCSGCSVAAIFSWRCSQFHRESEVRSRPMSMLSTAATSCAMLDRFV